MGWNRVNGLPITRAEEQSDEGAAAAAPGSLIVRLLKSHVDSRMPLRLPMIAGSQKDSDSGAET